MSATGQSAALLAAVLVVAMIVVIAVRAAPDLLTTPRITAAPRRTRPPRLPRRRSIRRHQHRAFPDTLDLLILAIRAGLTPRQAIEVIAEIEGPCQHALANVVRRAQRGQPFADALRAIDDELGAWATPSVDAIATCDRYGLGLEQMLEQLTADARAARQRLAQAAARRLPVTLSFPLVACTLPSFVLLAIVPAVLAALSSLQVPAW